MTNMIQGPMRALPGDADSVVELANECFPHDRDAGGIIPRWPHALSQVENRFVIKDDDKVVSHVGYTDQTILVEGKEIKVAGITFVSTYPDYRGKSFMTQLLNCCISAMTEEGYAFSDLGGNRQRYNHFGWENAGREWSFHITRRSLMGIPIPVKLMVTPYQASSEEIDAIIAIHDQEPLRMKRTRELYKMLLGRMGKQVWLASGNDGIKAYVVSELREKHQSIMEFGGSKEGIYTIFRHFIETLGNESIHVNSPWPHLVNPMLFSVSSGWNLDCPRMLKILDLEATLRGFTNQLKNRYSELGFNDRRTIVLGVEGSEKQVEVTFSSEEAVVSKTSQCSKALMLSEHEMVRFIFGPASPGITAELPSDMRFLNAILPVDFYLWNNETV
jgi:predicted acetyltransferase